MSAWLRPLKSYGFALGAVACGLLLRELLTAWVGPGLPTFITFYPAVMVAALLGGLGPGLVATLLAALAADYWVLEPVGAFAIGSLRDAVGVGLFCCMGVLISVVVHLYQRARHKAAAYDQAMALGETLREKAFLANLVENASQPFAVGYPDGRMGLVNHAYEQLTGYSAAELHALDWSTTLTPPDWREMEEQKLDQLRRTGQPVRYEKEYLRKGGTRIPVELLVHLVCDAKGQPEYYYSFLTDITERRQAQQAVRANEERLRQLNVDLRREVAERTRTEQSLAASLNRYFSFLDLTGQVGWTTDAHGLVTEDMPAWRKFTGQSIEEIRGWGWADALHPDDLEHTAAVWRTAVAARTSYATEYRLRRHDGVYRDFLARGVPVFHDDGSIREWVGTCIDITERKQVEEKLHQFNAELERQVAQQTVEIQLANETLEQRIAARTAELQAANAVMAESRRAALNLMDDAVAARRQAEQVSAELHESEARLRRLAQFPEQNPNPVLRVTEDGSLLYANEPGRAVLAAMGHADGQPLPDAVRAVVADTFRQGHVVEAELDDQHGRTFWFAAARPADESHANLYGRDVTTRKRAEEALQRTADQLARSNQELEQFAYVASHDLQEPLRVVAGYVQLIDRKYRNRLDADADEFFHYIVDGVTRMQQLITDLLNYSRLGTRGKPLVPTSMHAVLDHVMANLKTVVDENHATVTYNSVPTVQGDETQLVQLFQNLIGNGIKFHGDHPPQIDISARRNEDHWEFAVHDNGIGIDREYWEQIFVIFQRLHTRQKYAGTGIGLAICKRIVERHGGRIWLDSQPGQGTTFYFTLC